MLAPLSGLSAGSAGWLGSFVVEFAAGFSESVFCICLLLVIERDRFPKR